MRKVLSLAFASILVALIAVYVPLAMASFDQNSTKSPVSTAVSVTPITEEASYAKTIVNPTTSKVEPVRVAAIPENSSTPSFPWIYILTAAGFTSMILVAFAVKKRQRKFSASCFKLAGLIALLMTSVGQVYGQENLNVSIWGNLGDIIGLPMIVRESVDSAGNVWFGSFWAHKIGRLNPSTNEIRTWIVPLEISPGSGVQTVSVDPTDKVWFTAINRVGVFDPSTNFFTIWPVDGVSKGFLPFAFPLVSVDSYGNAFFPILDTNKIARINPVTNELTEWVIPTNNSKPAYTMVDVDSNVWFAEQGGNKIGRLNPYTNEITEWAIPTPNARPSGLFVFNGLVYFAEGAPRKIGRLNPKTNQMTEWSLNGLPGQGDHLHGAFVDLNANVWFTDYVQPSWGEWYSYLYRLGADNIFTYWQFAPAKHYSYGVTVDTKADVGAVFVGGYVCVSEYTTEGYAILRFRPAA